MEEASPVEESNRLKLVNALRLFIQDQFVTYVETTKFVPDGTPLYSHATKVNGGYQIKIIEPGHQGIDTILFEPDVDSNEDSPPSKKRKLSEPDETKLTILLTKNGPID